MVYLLILTLAISRLGDPFTCIGGVPKIGQMGYCVAHDSLYVCTVDKYGVFHVREGIGPLHWKPK